MYRQRDMAKLTVAIWNFPNTPTTGYGGQDTQRECQVRYFHGECEQETEQTRRPYEIWLDGWDKTAYYKSSLDRRKRGETSLWVKENHCRVDKSLYWRKEKVCTLIHDLAKGRDEEHGSLADRNHRLITTGSVVRKKIKPHKRTDYLTASLPYLDATHEL
jgi:hypothetical protein